MSVQQPRVRTASQNALRARLARLSTTAADALSLVAIGLSSLLLHWRGITSGANYYERDTWLFYFPLAEWIGGQLKAGSFPLWLPNIFTGYPIFADGELGLAYLPQVLLLWLLPSEAALVWMRVLHVFLAGAFAYGFFRSAIRLDPLPALGGALVFAFGSFLTAQMHHENVVRSAIWLPLVLLLADRSLRARDAGRWGWLALGSIAFSQALLGLHVQPVLMMAMTMGWWVVFHWITNSTWRVPRLPLRRAATSTVPIVPSPKQPLHRRLSSAFPWPLMVLLGIPGGGAAIAAVQIVPLLEWARRSSRAGGVGYEFGSAFGLATENLPTLLFPYFFRLPDAATWWSLWQQWETTLYVGIATLALAFAGTVAGWRRHTLFFLLLGVVSLLIGMTHYSPIFNIHELLWSIPGFSFLRAPGRFTYVIVFAFAGLAALGLQSLQEATSWQRRSLLAVIGSVPAIVLLAVLLALFPTWRDSLAADAARGQVMLQSTYLAVRAQYAMEPQTVYDGLLWSLSLANPKTVLSLSLLGVTALLFLAWLWLGRERARFAQSLFVLLITADLLLFAADFHPRADLRSLTPPALVGVPVGARVLVRAQRSLPNIEPNSLLPTDVRLVNGYSSLPSRRHLDLFSRSLDEPALLRVWAAQYFVEPTQPLDAESAGGVEYRMGYPLAAGFAGGGSEHFRPPADLGPIATLRIVGTLTYAFQVPQGETVAQITLTDDAGRQTVIPLRAGFELAERAIDRASIKPLAQHQKPASQTALDFEDWSPDGEGYIAHIYLADIPLPTATRISRIDITPSHSQALTYVHGLGLIGTDGSVRSLGFHHLEGLREVSRDAEDTYVVYEDQHATPRAFVQPGEWLVEGPSKPIITPVDVMGGGGGGSGFDPSRNVMLEGVAIARGENYGCVPGSTDKPCPAGLARAAATVEDLGPNALRITVENAPAGSYLVVNDVAHRGWSATVNGRSAPLVVANALFRAVPLEPGNQVVVMTYAPLTHILGAALSAVALLSALAVAAVGFTAAFRARRRARRLGYRPV